MGKGPSLKDTVVGLLLMAAIPVGSLLVVCLYVWACFQWGWPVMLLVGLGAVAIIGPLVWWLGSWTLWRLGLRQYTPMAPSPYPQVQGAVDAIPPGGYRRPSKYPPYY